MQSPPRMLLWLVPLALLSCAIVIENHLVQDGETAAPRPTVNHKLHTERDLECADCHDPDETQTPVMPKAKTCFECHETLEEENERVRAYFDATRQEDGTWKFTRPAFMDDVVPNHEGHAKYEVGCTECHGEVSEAAFVRPEPLAFMNACSDCHIQRKAPNECSTCHEQTRKDQKPASHDAAFRRVHGGQAPEGWQRGEGASCAICHSVPRDCNSCHTSTKPGSHSEAGFRLYHGRGQTDAGDLPFGDTSCALCHKQLSCVRCHQTEKPRYHTVSFERRLHGIRASVERQSCLTCHKQDTCVRCHQTTKPITHRASWGSGQQAHCIGCHDPLPASGCYTCHKSTLGHLQATPLPAGAPHATATDCLTCHTVLPHLDDGGNCRRCHR